MRVIKRDGTSVEYDESKIINAINGANNEMAVDEDRVTIDQISNIVTSFNDYCTKSKKAQIEVEEIQDFIEKELMKLNKYSLMKAYIIYRYKQAQKRNRSSFNDSILSLINGTNAKLNDENSNKDSFINSVQRDYIAGEVSKDISRESLIPADIMKAHDEGLIHFHDMDYFLQFMHNCDLVNLEDMLNNNTVISKTLIESPHTFSTACNIATQIVSQVASSQLGGQSITMSHLAPFVQKSREKFRDKVREMLAAIDLELKDEKINKMAEILVRYDIEKGIQTIQYQIQTLLTTNGQAPFLSVFLWINEVPEGQTRDDLALIIEEVLRQRMIGVKNEKGVYVTPAFPKLLYVTDENNIYEGTKYWYLTELAVKCSLKRMVPDYVSAKKMRELKEGNVFPPMGCRSSLSPWKNEKGEYQFYGRFNGGVVTVNLVDVACSSNGDMEKFWEILDERLEICHKALLVRYDRLKQTTTTVAPILWEHGALARLEKGSSIAPLLEEGRTTFSLGYAGLAETVYRMTGKSHTDEKVKPFALDIMRRMNNACDEWTLSHPKHIKFSVYGTPLESTTYKFAECLKKRFGVIEGVTDKNYITNSYHVRVTEEIDAMTKLAFEADFQDLSLGGAISYIEVPNMSDNLEAALSTVQFMYDNILYAEFNSKSDYCHVCGYDGEIKIVKDNDDRLVWECPLCKNRDQHKMDVARRTCGYIGTQFWNQGRTQEIAERVLHL